MKCFRVVVHGITREPTEADSDGDGFYAAQSVRAENEQHAVELAFRNVREDPRSTEEGPIPRLAVEDAFEIDPSRLEERYGYIYYGGK
jgi:hypothetical protein